MPTERIPRWLLDQIGKFGLRDVMETAPTKGQAAVWDPTLGTNGAWTPGTVSTVYDRVTTDVVVVNSAAETTLFSKSIAAGDLSTNRRLRLTLEGTYTNNSGAARTLQLKVKLGATTMIDVTTANIAASATARAWKLVVELSAQAATNAQFASVLGALGAVSTAGSGVGAWVDGSGTEHFPIVAVAAATEDTTADKTLAVTVQHSAADPNLTMTLAAALLEVL